MLLYFFDWSLRGVSMRVSKIVIIYFISLFSCLVHANSLSNVAKAVVTRLDSKNIAKLIESSPLKFNFANAEMSIVKKDTGEVMMYQSVRDAKANKTTLREVPIDLQAKVNSTWNFETDYSQAANGLGFKLSQVYQDVARMGENKIKVVKDYFLNTTDSLRTTKRIKKSREPSDQYVELTGKASPEYISLNNPNGKPPFYGSLEATQIDVDAFNAVTPKRKSVGPKFVNGNFTLNPQFEANETLVDMTITDSLDRIVLTTSQGREFTYKIPKDRVPQTGVLTAEETIKTGVSLSKFREKVLTSVAFESSVKPAGKGIELDLIGSSVK